MDNQYRIITAQAGWFDRGARGRIRFAGPDAAPFLQALLSNDVARLTHGHGVYAAYLTPQGRMIADIDVLHRGDCLLGSVAEGRGPELSARFDSLIFSEDLVVSDVTGEWSEMDVTGGDVVARLATALGLDAVRLSTMAELDQEDWESGWIVRVGESSFPMFRVFAAAAERDRTIARLEQAGVAAMPLELSTALRIEAGRAAWGSDLSSETIPLEAGLLDRAISTTKGCYVGQEIIIRILHRGGGRVARRLVILALDSSVAHLPLAGRPLISDGEVVGHITSAAYSPARSQILALGYVRRDRADLGRSLMVGEGAGTAEIQGFAC